MTAGSTTRPGRLLDRRIAEGAYVTDGQENYYIYRLTMDGRAQTGIVACCSIDDYVDGVIKKHENTREDKEIDRIRHVDTTNAHTGPIFLAYRADRAVNRVVDQVTAGEPLYDFVSEDGNRAHGVEGGGPGSRTGRSGGLCGDTGHLYCGRAPSGCVGGEGGPEAPGGET